MRKMQQHIVTGKEIFIGLEDSKKTWKLCIRCEGQIVHQVSMPAQYAGLQRYLQRHYPDGTMRLLYEAGFGGFWLHDQLTADGGTCIVTPPHTVTQAKVSPVKTDKRDARRLARNLETGDYTACHVPDPERRADRQVSRTLDQVQKDLKRVKNRIRRFLDVHGLNATLPAGRWTATQYQRLRAWQLGPGLQTALDVYLAQLDQLESLATHLKATLRQISRKPRYQAAVHAKESCPGIGWFSAIRLTLEWGEMTRFPSGKHLAAFTGLTSREYSTGETVHRGRITGASPWQVRAWLVQCAWRSLAKDPVLGQTFHTVRAHSGSKKKAIVAVARKLAVRMRAVELRQQEYVPGVLQ